jgi:hypothetical protein
MTKEEALLLFGMLRKAFYHSRYGTHACVRAMTNHTAPPYKLGNSDIVLVYGTDSECVVLASMFNRMWSERRNRCLSEKVFTVAKKSGRFELCSKCNDRTECLFRFKTRSAAQTCVDYLSKMYSF